MPRSKTGIKRPAPDIAALKEAANAVQQRNTSIRVAARQYHVSRTTLKRFIESGDNYSSYKNCATHQVFSSNEENDLAKYLVTASHMHYGLSRRGLQTLAYEFALANKKRIPESWERNGRAGKQWYLDFMKRHRHLSLRKPQATSLSRGTSFNKHNVDLFFSKLTELMDRHHFTPDQIYNLDESGNTNVHVPERVVACKGVKQVGSATSGERGTNVTFIACVNALGNTVPPLYVFPRVNFKDFMLKGAPTGSIGAAHPSGWSNGVIFVKYLQHFINHVKCSEAQPVLLILDNHESHITVEALNLAKTNGVTILTLPPHTSHKLQPLDRSVFGPYKTYYNNCSCDWMREHPGKTISIYDIAEISGKAYNQAFTPGNIQSGFRVSGIWPVNVNIFQDHEFMSSAVTDRPIENDEDRAENADNENTYTSPEVVKPFPKAAPRVATSRGRKKGACRILTDTPEKEEVERCHIERLNKKQKKSITTVKRQVLQETSSDETSDESVIYDDDSDLDVSDDLDDVEESNSVNFHCRYVDLEVGCFYLTRLEGKKKEHYYVAELIKVAPDITVRYLKRCYLNKNKFVQEKDQDFSVEIQDLILKLPDPRRDGLTQRQKETFYFDFDFTSCNVNVE